jgi:hypothetical protein
MYLGTLEVVMKRSLLVLALLVVPFTGSCVKELDEEYCQRWIAKGTECNNELFLGFSKGICQGLGGKPVADLKTLDKFLDMSCEQLGPAFLEELSAAKEREKKRAESRGR